MENLQSLNIELKKYLEEKISPTLIVELSELLNDKNINYLNNKSKADTKALYFEYQYDYLNIIFWAVDQEGERITEIIKLPSKEIDIINESDDWDALIPEKIWVTVTAFEDIYEEDNSDDILDEYNTEKYELFENWFLECWKKAAEQTKVEKDAYFSIHDTYFKTDLHSMETINTDEISKRYQ